MGLTAKFGPAFSSQEQQRTLSKISNALKENGISIHCFDQALLVPENSSAVQLRNHKKPSVFVDLDSSEHVRFVRGVLNSPKEKNRIDFAAHSPKGFPHGFVPKPTEW